MSINGTLNLACRVQLHTLATTRLVLEPLPGFEIIKDLVVNMDDFWRKYERVEPWLHAEVSTAKESRMSESQRAQIDQFIHCILCGICYAACPARKANAAFTGPAALAKLYRFITDRFITDSRETRRGKALRGEDSSQGVWGCRTIMKCVGTCPKDVRPADAIRGARRKLVSQRIKEMLQRISRED
jgi:succinate dehydrogenase / fumarate reductase iron-sulfur subunit